MVSEIPQQIKKPLSLNDASAFKKELIDRWKNKSEVWAFAYGDDILATASVLSSVYTTYFFRCRLNLLKYAAFTAYAPSAILGYILAENWHENFINSRILRYKSCSICTEVAAGLGQAVIASVYPLIICPVVCFSIADHMHKYPVPPIRHAPMEVIKLWKKMIRPHRTTFLTICGFQMAMAMFITQQKIQTFAESCILSQPKKQN